MKSICFVSVRLFHVLIVGLLLGSCAVPKVPEDDIRRYFPFQVGLTATFRIMDFDEKDRVTMSEFKLACLRREMFQGRDCYVAEVSAYGGKSPFLCYWAWEKDGLSLCRRIQEDYDDILDPPDIHLKFPLTVGEEWGWEGLMLKKKQKSTHRTEGFETIEAPAGRFEAVRIYDETFVEVNGSWVRTFWGYHWFAKDVGMVKVETSLLHPSGERFHGVAELKEIKMVPPQEKGFEDISSNPGDKDPWIGQPAPLFTLENIDGTRVAMESARQKKPAMLVFGSATSQACARSAPVVKRLYEKYKNDMTFFWIYTQEANPSDGAHPRQDVPLIPAPKSIEDRVRAARSAREGWKLNFPVLVDGLADETSHAYAMAEGFVLLDEEGRILWRETSFDNLMSQSFDAMVGHLLHGPRGYYPLEVGYRWEYQTNQPNQPGFALTVSKREKIDGVECSLREKVVGDQTILIDCMVHQDEGLLFYKEYNPWGADDFIDPQMILKYPLHPGEKWVWSGEVNKLKLKRSFTLEGEETIRTPAGVFFCLRIGIESEASDGTRVSEKRWFARGIGMARESARILEKGKETIYLAELKEFRLTGKR